MKKFFLALLPLVSFAQSPSDYWQQKVHYKMDIDFDVDNHQFTGNQKLTYYNNSPDTLRKVFYHLYFNAFQPGSMMDMRSRDLPDPDKRIGERIGKLKKKEIGYHHITSLLQDGEKTDYKTVETLLQVNLAKPVYPGDSTVFEMTFNSQVPKQIRRSGRDNAEGVDYTMTQWYPKMAEYDEDGWHPNPYVAREFYGVFGKFEVNISIHYTYVLGGTGVLQNSAAKWGLDKKIDDLQYYKLLSNKKTKRTWRFVADNVHDFAWAADPDFIRTSYPGPDDLELNFYYLPGKWQEKWDSLPRFTAQFFDLMNKNFGQYAYPQFSVIQGGDGGMEYPMCTMLKGTGKMKGLVGVMVHESAHNWYYGMLASNEFQYPWMDEGFTSYAEEEILNIMRGKNEINPHRNAIGAHNFLVSKSEGGEFEPLSTPADYFSRNRTYGISAYSRGEVFLAQLRYIVGDWHFKRGMLRYFEMWKFKHPDPWDFIKVMEDVSGMQLDWYLNFWLNTTKSIDYGIKEVETKKGTLTIVLERKGEMPMPVDLTLEFKDGSYQTIYIPIVSMFGYKPDPELFSQKPWPWTSRTYEINLEMAADDLKRMTIDRHGFTADTGRSNNVYEID